MGATFFLQIGLENVPLGATTTPSFCYHLLCYQLYVSLLARFLSAQPFDFFNIFNFTSRPHIVYLEDLVKWWLRCFRFLISLSFRNAHSVLQASQLQLFMPIGCESSSAINFPQLPLHRQNLATGC